MSRTQVHSREKGTAYAFFAGPQDPDKLTDELPYIRQLIRTPDDVDVEVIHGTYSPSDTALSRIAHSANEAGMKYVMKVILEGEHERASDETAVILNQACNSHLYREGEQFRGEIVHPSGRRYAYRD